MQRGRGVQGDWGCLMGYTPTHPLDFDNLPQVAWPKTREETISWYEQAKALPMRLEPVSVTVTGTFMSAEEYARYSQPQLVLYAPDDLDPWLVGCVRCGMGLPLCRCREHRLKRYAVPDGPWYYRLWVWCVVHLCG